MSNVTEINSAAREQVKAILGATLDIDTSSKIPHSERGHMVVGEKYEMFIPAAQGAAQNLGIVWHDDKGYTFTYLGTTSLQGELYIITDGIHYEGKQIPPSWKAQFDLLLVILHGASPLCPAYVAVKFVRPVTSE